MVSLNQALCRGIILLLGFAPLLGLAQNPPAPDTLELNVKPTQKNLSRSDLGELWGYRNIITGNGPFTYLVSGPSSSTSSLLEFKLSPYFIFGTNVIKAPKMRILSATFFTLSMQVDFRMYDKYSAPIRTPNFEPIISVNHFFSRLPQRITKWVGYGTFSVAHLSNGQDGQFYVNGQPNHTNGNFSTEYFEFGPNFSRLIKSAKARKDPDPDKYDSWIHLSAAFRTYWGGRTGSVLEMEPGLRSAYGYMHPWVKGRYYRKLGNYEITTDLRLGYIVDPRRDIAYTHQGMFLRRFTAEFIASFHPDWFQDLSFILHAYMGPDYYNVYFNDQYYGIKVGIGSSLNHFRLPDLKRIRSELGESSPYYRGNSTKKRAQ